MVVSELCQYWLINTGSQWGTIGLYQQGAFEKQCLLHDRSINRQTVSFLLFLAVLGLCCCPRAFSSCGEWRLLFLVVLGLVEEHRP